MKQELLEKLIYKLIDGETSNIEENKTIGSENIGKYVILRGYDSGVHFGKLEFASKGLYRLTESRRLWYWYAKQGIGLSSVALYGLRNESKICGTIPRIEITDERICEIIPCSDEAIKSIKEIKEYNPS